MNQVKPTLRQLGYFVAVAETESFRGAADRLKVSQPTLTQQVLALEAALGLRLFERSRAGTRLTVSGRELLPDARRIGEQIQGICDHADSLSRGPAGTHRLGVTPTLGPYLLPHVLPAIHRRYAALKLYVREDAPRDLESGLISGDYDVILSALPISDIRLSVVPLFREPVKLVVAADHRLGDKESIGREDLRGESVLTIEEHHHFHQQIQRLCDRLGANVSRDFEGTSLDTLRQMVVMGTGVAFLPALYIRSEVHRPDEVRVVTLADEDVRRTHALAWRRTSPAAQLYQEIASEIRELAAEKFEEEVEVLYEATSGT